MVAIMLLIWFVLFSCYLCLCFVCLGLLLFVLVSGCVCGFGVHVATFLFAAWV